MRYWQELLMIVTGALSFGGYIIHVTNNDANIEGKSIVYLCGPLFILSCLWYCKKQIQWSIIREFFWWQLRPISLLIIAIVLCIMEIIVNTEISGDIESVAMHIIFSVFFAFSIIVFIVMETASKVSILLYIFYPLTICLACFINIIRSYFWKTITINHGNIHTFDMAQIDRLFQAQICLTMFISFIFAVNNPSRKYYTLLTKPISRDRSVHESHQYESYKKFSLFLQFSWSLLSIIVLLFEYSKLDIKNPIMDIILISGLIINTITLIYIEFDWKILKRLIMSHTFIILFLSMCALCVRSFIVLSYVVTQDFALVSMNEIFWVFGIMYMVLIDGYRKARCWYRLFVYAIYVCKGITQIARTWWDFIDIHLYPQTTDWYKDNPDMSQIMDNINRFGWYFVVGIAFLSCFDVMYDPDHSCFVMCVEPLSRTESGLASNIGIQSSKQPVTSSLWNDSPIQQKQTKVKSYSYQRPIASKDTAHSFNSSLIGSTGIVVANDDDDRHSLITLDGSGATISTSSKYRKKISLKMDL